MEKWENPSGLSEHLMRAHACFPEEVVSLSGKWRFYSQSSALPLPEGWVMPAFNDKKWGRIQVPCAWETADVPVSGTDTTGLYRKSFLLSNGQGKRQIILRFESVGFCALLWVNGTYIGMAKGMRSPAEFDITAAVCPEKNTICVQVLKSAGESVGEGDGPFRSTGILGDVTLYSLPERAITQIHAYPQWHPDGTPLLHVRLNTRGSDGFTARIALMDENRVVSYCESNVVGDSAEALLPCPEIALWCSEHPKLYRVAVILWNGDAMFHNREITLGFRRAEVQEQCLLLNGQPEKLFATEYRSFDPETGCALSVQQMEQDLSLLKNHHFNAISLTAPAPEGLYQLCDRLGIYILDHSGADTSREAFREQAEDQNRRLVETYGSHPSILAWNAVTEHLAILPMDKLAFRQNPGLETVSGDRPQILSYSRIPGNLDEVIPLVRNSQSIPGVVFGEFRPEHLRNQALTSSDRGATPLLRELRELLQPVRFFYEDGTLTATNLSRFRSTEGYVCRCLLTRDGETIVSRAVELEVAPGETKSTYVETQYDIFRSGRYHLTASYVHPESGAVLASGQWEVGHLRHILDENPGGTIREDQGSIHLRSVGSAYTVSRSTGALEQITLEDRPLLTAPVNLVFTSESETNTGFHLADEWEKVTSGRRKRKPSVLEVDHMTRTVSASYKLGSGLIQNCRLYSDGSMAYELRLRTGKTAPALLGVTFPLAKEMDRLQWFGLGPDDSTPEHRTGRFFGIHSQQADASPTGMKDPIYALTVTDSLGFGLSIRWEEGLRASLRSTENSNQLRLELPVSDLKPHTTYTFSFTLQPITE